LTESDVFCLVGDPTKFEAVLIVDQNDIEMIDKGNQVVIQLDHLPGVRFEGTIGELSRADIKALSRRVSQKYGGESATKTDEGGVERPLTPAYQALVALNDADGDLIQGLRGRARIDATWMTLWQRAKRLWLHTFNFKL
jgi:hypothetical protein